MSIDELSERVQDIESRIERIAEKAAGRLDNLREELRREIGYVQDDCRRLGDKIDRVESDVRYHR